MNKSNDNYNLIALASNESQLRLIIDSANAKYNNTAWRAFAEVLPARNNKSFQTIVKETGIAVKASILGATDQKPLRSVEGAQTYNDSILKIGHGTKVDQDDISFLEQMALVDSNMGDLIIETYRNRLSSILQGFHMYWNDWVFQALSDQQLTTQSLGGAKTVIDLRVPSNLKLKAMGTSAWFAPAVDGKYGYDVLADLRRMVKMADKDATMSANRVFVCSQELFDKIILDSPLIKTLIATINMQEGASPDPIELSRRMSVAFGIPRIIPIDDKSRHEVDGIPVISPNAFNPNKISLIPVSQLLDMHNSPSDYRYDTNPATTKTATEGGLIGALTSYGSEPFHIRTNMEAWSLITFKNPKSIVSLDTSVFSANGK